MVNVYKHGKGSSLNDLKARFQEYLPERYTAHDDALWNVDFRDHTDLNVSDEQLQEFSDAIVTFWRDVPEDIYDTQISDVPDWFEKAILKDQAARQQRKTK